MNEHFAIKAMWSFLLNKHYTLARRMRDYNELGFEVEKGKIVDFVGA